MVRRLPLRCDGKFRKYIVNIHIIVLVYVSIAKEDSLSSLIVLQRGVFTLFMPLKLSSAVQVDTGYVSNQTRVTYIPG